MPILVRGGETEYLFRIEKMWDCDVKRRQMNGIRDPRHSLSPRKLADSAGVAGTMVTDRDCLSKGKKESTGIFLRWDSHFRECGPDGSGSGES